MHNDNMVKHALMFKTADTSYYSRRKLQSVSKMYLHGNLSGK